jgi:Arc/MetJ family transcription regulator
MRTNIVLDDKLVAEGLRLSKLGSKKDLVNSALKEYVARRKRQNLLKYRGAGWEGDLNELRRGRFDSD